MRPKRSIVALIAAYAVALQALLLPLSVAAAAPFDAARCAQAPAGPSQPGDHAGLPCVAGCLTHCIDARAAPPAASSHAIARSSHRLTVVTALVPVRRATQRLPNIPRAPPAA